MRRSQLVDFYQGWLIEITQVEDGFHSTCRSAFKETLSNSETYKSDFDALGAAKRSIDRRVACHSLTNWLRELYESNGLSFEEWETLQQSLILRD
jgi:hypothetical protein